MSTFGLLQTPETPIGRAPWRTVCIAAFVLACLQSPVLRQPQGGAVRSNSALCDVTYMVYATCCVVQAWVSQGGGFQYRVGVVHAGMLASSRCFFTSGLRGFAARRREVDTLAHRFFFYGEGDLGHDLCLWQHFSPIRPFFDLSRN